MFSGDGLKDPFHCGQHDEHASGCVHCDGSDARNGLRRLNHSGKLQGQKPTRQAPRIHHQATRSIGRIRYEVWMWMEIRKYCFGQVALKLCTFYFRWESSDKRGFVHRDPYLGHLVGSGRCPGPSVPHHINLSMCPEAGRFSPQVCTLGTQFQDLLGIGCPLRA